ncbi:MAG: ferritin [Phycisphaeraceae bacterium]|nr:ferritin [Phycisphaeraceae bacterium]
MLKPNIEAALNKQVNHEMAAAYNYFAMEAWFERENLAGFARWMRIQREEELVHARKLFQYILDRGGKVELEAVAKPNADFKAAKDVFTRAFEQERANTRSIHAVYELAVNEKDYATQQMLQWFIEEQVEEEKITSETEALLEMAGDNPSALLLLNEKFGNRQPDAD